MDYSKLSTEELLTIKKDYENHILRYKAKEQAVKILLNSLYGALGNVHFRWYRLDFAEAITLSGQSIWFYAESKINMYLNKILGTTDVDYVIAGDTDSLYLDVTKFSERFFSGKSESEIIDLITKVCDGKLQEYIDSVCEEFCLLNNAAENKLSMKRESIASSIFFKKKKYAMIVYDNEGIKKTNPEPKIVGHEAIRSSTPEWCRNEMIETFKKIFYTNEKETLDYIDDVKNRFMELPLYEIGENISVNELEKYECEVGFVKGSTRQAKAAITFNRAIEKFELTGLYKKIQNGDKIKILSLYLPNPVGSEAIAFTDEIPSEFNLNKYIDKESQFDKTFLAPMQRVLSTIGWKKDQTPSLFDFV